MTRKRLLIIIIVITVIIGLTFILNNLTQKKADPIVPPKIDSPFTKPPTSHINLESTQGKVIVPNFYDNVVAEKDGNAILEETQDYQISFVISENRFYIDLLNPDLTVTIPKAERALMERLELDEEETCKLDIKVRTNPVFIPGPVETRNLSFCG